MDPGRNVSEIFNLIEESMGKCTKPKLLKSTIMHGVYNDLATTVALTADNVEGLISEGITNGRFSFTEL
jgi:hypothetical protein